MNAPRLLDSRRLDRAQRTPRARTSNSTLIACVLLTLIAPACTRRARTVTTYPDGTPLAEIDFAGRALDGAYVLHHRAGNPELEAHYVDGLREGTYSAWHPNGQRAVSGQYARGLRVGLWQEWGEGGTPISAGEYDAGDKVGTWRLYDEHGDLVAEDTWDRGTRLSRRVIVPDPASGATRPDAAPK